MKNLLVILLFILPLPTPAQDFGPATQSYKKTLGELIKADTTNRPGNEARAVAVYAARLKEAKIPYQTMEFGPHRTNLVARLKGSGEKKPLLLLAHTDVVGTQNQAWTVPPHEMTEKEGFLYGRGVVDDHGMGAANLETFIALKKQNVPLKRDVILALTGDEESGGQGIRQMIEKHPDWIDAEIGFNEGGRVSTDEEGHVKFISLGVAEKTYQDFTLYVKGTTGHSSVPKGDNAIYLMAAAVDRLAKYKPKERLLPAVREYFKKRALLEKPEIAKAMTEIAEAKGPLPKQALEVLKQNPTFLPQLFTTCIPTLINGGIRVNALPPDVTVNVNCRVLPDEPVANVRRRLAEIIDDSRIQIKDVPEAEGGGVSPIQGEVPDAVKKITKEMWPEAPVITSMMTGATDSRFLRLRGMKIYGLAPIPGNEIDTARSHGIDERLPVSGIPKGLEYQYRLVLELVK